MQIINTISNWLVAIKDAKNSGITNDAALKGWFKAEYKQNAEGAYEYWIITRDTNFFGK